MVRKAIFPGSFDPFTAGHLNILKRALTMFDEVVVAVGVNIDKRGFFPNEKRIDIIRLYVEYQIGIIDTHRWAFAVLLIEIIGNGILYAICNKL